MLDETHSYCLPNSLIYPIIWSTRCYGLPNPMVYPILWSAQSYGLPNPMVCPIQLEIARFVMKTEWKWGNPSRVNIQRSPTAIEIFGQHVQCQWCSLLFGATIEATHIKASITIAKIQNMWCYVMICSKSTTISQDSRCVVSLLALRCLESTVSQEVLV